MNITEETTPRISIKASSFKIQVKFFMCRWESIIAETNKNSYVL